MTIPPEISQAALAVEGWMKMNDVTDFQGLSLRGPDPSRMRLRDEFAKAALSAILVTRDEAKTEQVAQWAYEVADAMLEAREA